MTQSPFVVGAEVVVVSGNWGRHLSPKRKIAKVYKNGNFLLEGSDRQYKPRAFSNGVPVAHRAGKHNYYGDHVELWNDEYHGAELAARAKEREVANTVAVFEAWLRGKRSGNGRYHLTAEQVAALEAIVLADKKEEAIPPHGG